jgi:hypothetical protein
MVMTDWLMIPEVVEVEVVLAFAGHTVHLKSVCLPVGVLVLSSSGAPQLVPGVW